MASSAGLHHSLTCSQVWAPQPDWELGFSAAAGAEPANHWIDELRIRTGTLIASTLIPVPLRVALNGQQYVGVHEALAYEFEGGGVEPTAV